MKTALLATLFFSIHWHAFGMKPYHDDVKQKCLSIQYTYLEEAFSLTKNSVGFTPPVSGRAYAYLSIAMYESMIPILPNLQSLEGQLNGYVGREQDTTDLNWMIVANTVNYQMLSYLYQTMPPSNAERLEFIHDSIMKIYRRKCSKNIVNRSIIFGQHLALDVIQWSQSDGGDDGYDLNYPEDYNSPACESCWTRTFPGYLPALLPYWGQNRPMLANSQKVAAEMEIYEFSTDTGTVMYQEAMMVLQNSLDTDPKYELIAEYWDDAAGYSGTPTGHFYTIAISVAKQQQLGLEDAMVLFAKLGVAVNEAFISAFYLKYKFNFIRPITYIQSYIDPNFNTRLASPPFPEYPSGHSFQSGAASEIMKSVFGDSITFSDSTNNWRTDIDGTPRTFNSFTEMSEEISISRFYGGIHFSLTLSRSLDYGRLIGQYVTNNLKCRRE